MYKFDKKRKLVTTECKECKGEVKFKVPDDLLDDKQDFPVAFRYIHGDPIHSLTLYFDKSFNIRGMESGDSLALSNDIVRKYIESCELDENADAATFLRTLVNALTTVLKLYPDIRDDILYRVGLVLGEAYAEVFTAESEVSLLIVLGKFWERNNFGTFTDIEQNGTLVSFNVKDCFECSYLPNLGKPMCSLDQGFMQGILEKNFNNQYQVKEVECYAMGNDRCRFEVEKMN